MLSDVRDGLIKIGIVMQMVSMSRSAVYKEMKKGTFPRQKQQSARAVAWVRSEVEAWIASRPRK